MPQIIRRDAKFAAAARRVPEETPVALVFHGTTLAVLMATPADLEDFAVGFSLTEGIIRDRSEIEDLTVIFSDDGIELRMWLAAGRADQLQSRRRSLVGPTGCGELFITMRLAAAFYFVKRYNLDLQDTIDPARQQLWLTNLAELNSALHSAKEQSKLLIAQKAKDSTG